jgi:hypothetical protein
MAITVPIISQFNAKGIEQAKKEFEKLETPAQKAGFALQKAFAPAAIALGALTGAAINFAKAAADDQASSKKLEGQLKRTTGATDDQIKSIEAWIGQLELATNIADNDLRDALGKLTTVTKDAGEAQKILALATDISAATGKDLGSVTDALAKAYGGNMTALQKLDPSLRDAIKAGADFDTVGQSLADTFGGAAADATNTAEGRFKNLQVRVGNLQERFGYMVLEIADKLLPVLDKLMGFVENNTDKIAIAAAVVGGLAGTIVALNTAMKIVKVATTVWTTAVKILNIVMAANPIVLVVIAIGLLIAAVILAYKRFETFRDVVDAVFRFFRRIIETAVEYVMGLFESFKGYLNGFLEVIKGVLTGDIGRVIDGFKDIFKNGVKLVVDIMLGLPGKILKALAGPLLSLGKDIIGKIVDGIKSAAGAIGGAIMGAIPGGGLIGGAVSAVRGILPFAEGGIVTRPTLGLVGEAGPEAVIPLDKAGMLGGGITINVAGSVIEERDLVERIRVGLIQSQRNGRQVA